MSLPMGTHEASRYFATKLWPSTILSEMYSHLALPETQGDSTVIILHMDY